MTEQNENEKKRPEDDQREQVVEEPTTVETKETVVDVAQEGDNQTVSFPLDPKMDKAVPDEWEGFGDRFLLQPIKPLTLTDEFVEGIIEPEQTTRKYNEWHAKVLKLGTGPFTRAICVHNQDGQPDLFDCKIQEGDRVVLAGKAMPITLDHQTFWVCSGTMIQCRVKSEEPMVPITWPTN